MEYKKVFGWLTFDMILFLLANAILIYYFHDRFVALRAISYFELLVFGLAVFRAAHIISNEVVTKPLRAPFVDIHKEHGKLVEEPKKAGFRGAFGMLIYCPSCSGVWIAALFVYSYIFWPKAVFLIAVLLALSGLERIFSYTLGFLKGN